MLPRHRSDMMLNLGTIFLMAVVGYFLLAPGQGSLWRIFRSWNERRAMEALVSREWNDASTVGGWRDETTDTGAGGRADMVVFMDYQCPYCRRLEAGLDSLAKLGKGYHVRIRHFPIRSHEAAGIAATAAICGDVIGEFRHVHSYLMGDTTWYSLRSASSIGRAASVRDTAGFTKCLLSDTPDSVLGRDRDLAERLSIHATPSILLPSRVVQGLPPMSALQIMTTAGKH